MDKKHFDEMYVGKDIYINCPTEELARALLYEADKHGYTWSHWQSYLNDINYNKYLSKTTYNISRGRFYSTKNEDIDSESLIIFIGHIDIPEQREEFKKIIKTAHKRVNNSDSMFNLARAKIYSRMDDAGMQTPDNWWR